MLEALVDRQRTADRNGASADTPLDTVCEGEAVTPELSDAYSQVARLTERVRELEELVMVLAKFDQPHCYSSKNGTPIFVMNGRYYTWRTQVRHGDL